MKKWCFAGCLCCFLIVFLCVGAFAEVERLALEDTDCAKCHPEKVQELSEKGAKHADVGCVDCHPEHPPIGKEPIAACDACHDSGSSDHYAIEGCKACHVPHQPTDIDFTKVAETKPACLSCHPEKGKDMAERPSLHADLDCLECHPSHGESTECLGCHEAHAEGMTFADCRGCHTTHTPKEVAYGDAVPNNYCTCCHGDIAEALEKSQKAHMDVACIECHVEKHGFALACVECHDATLHGENIHKKFPECLTCHMEPHSLGQ